MSVNTLTLANTVGGCGWHHLHCNEAPTTTKHITCATPLGVLEGIHVLESPKKRFFRTGRNGLKRRFYLNTLNTCE